MYEAYFGLKSNPFGAKTDGAGVFVGPQQNKVINALQKALKTQDAVVTLTGPVGVGKTTIVTRALQAMSPGRTAAWVGRMQLGANDLTELLLAGFGIASKSKGPVRRFAAFRRLTQIQAENGAPVAIIVEDAHRIGIDALDELEALTSADSGDTDGSNIILMGQPGLNDRLKTPELARLRQRMRLRQEIDPLSTAEVRGYLKHVVRQAGGDFDQLFGNGVIEIVAQGTDGIPRMINSLCSAAMSAAMEAGQKQVSRTLLAQIARDTFGFEFEEAAPASEVAPAPSDEIAPAATPDAAGQSAAAESVPAADKPAAGKRVGKSSPMDALPPAARNVVVESGRYPETDNEPSSADDDTTTVADDTFEDEIPELINDTQPALEQIDAEALTGMEAVAADATSPHKVLPDTASPPKASEIKSASPGDAAIEKPAAAASATADDDAKSRLEKPASKDSNAESIPTPVATKAKAADDAGAPPADAATDISDELPTLSESMRVHALPETEASDATPASAAVAESEAPDAQPEAIAVFDPTATLADALETAQQETAHLQELEAAATGPADEAVAEIEPAMIPELEPEAIPERDRASAVPPSLAEAQAPGMDVEASAEGSPESAAETPSITLDDAVDQRAPATPAIQDKEKLERFAEEISNANSLEDISELMAETLFGNQDLDQIAAEIAAEKPAAAPPTPAPADNPVKLDATVAQEADEPNIASPDVTPEPPGVPPALQKPQIDPVATGEIALTLELEQSGVHPASSNGEAASPVPEPAADSPAPSSPEPKASSPASAPGTSSPGEHNLRDSVAMRIEMLNKMNAAAEPAAAQPPRRKAAPQPEPIEEQITTSMTQTLEALKVSKKAAPTPPDDDEVEEKKSGGLFSRFRRSS